MRVPFGTIDPALWETLVPEGEAVLSRPAVCGDEVLAVSTLRALDRIVRFGADGSSRGSIEGVGDVVAVVALTADRGTGRAFAVVDSFDVADERRGGSIPVHRRRAGSPPTTTSTRCRRCRFVR